jgi:hypothetical protein
MRTRTFNLKVSTIELKEKLLSHFKTNPFFDTLAEIIIDSIDNENNLARLYSYVAGIVEPISMEEVAKNTATNIADDFVLKPFEAGVKTLPTKPEFATSDGTEIKLELLMSMQSLDVEALISHVEKMSATQLVVIDGRVFARIDDTIFGRPVIRMIEQKNNAKGCFEGSKDYLERKIIYLHNGKYSIVEQIIQE